jgi:formylglycine-generating enzyme required for sulfatase activity
MIRITGGTFVIGSTADEAAQAGIAYERYRRDQGDQETATHARRWPQNEINADPLRVDSFELARYPVTNAQYRLFIDAGGYRVDAPWWDGPGRAWLQRDDAKTNGLERWQIRTYKDRPKFWEDEWFGKTRPNHPVVGINWYEATAFCAWLTEYLNDGYVYRLPSEAEWEYAARGAARRPYPWGEVLPDGERANFNQTHGGTSAVGCFPAGATPEGLLDMAGNVWEWTRSEYRPYPYDPNDGRESGADPAKKRFTVRGGSWIDHPFYLRAARRSLHDPITHDFIGLRLARHRKV